MNIPYAVWSSYFIDLPPEGMVDAFTKAGYFCTEFSDEHGAILLERAAGIPGGAEKVGHALKKYADERGFSFPQGHLYLKVDLCADDAVEIMKPWLDLFVSMGIRAGVLHTSCRQADLSAEQRYERWVSVLSELSGYLAGTDMSIALENAGGYNYFPESLLSLIDAAGGKHLGICLDTGHLNLSRHGKVPAYGRVDCTQSEFIRRAGDRLIALHIADNDGTADQHLMPFGRGNVNFTDVTDGLREVKYRGLFNLEIPGERHAPMEVRMAKLAYIHEMCRYLLRD